MSKLIIRNERDGDKDINVSKKKSNDIDKRVQKNHLIDSQSIDDDELSTP